MRLPYAGIIRIRFNGYNLRLRSEPPLGEGMVVRRQVRVKQNMGYHESRKQERKEKPT